MDTLMTRRLIESLSGVGSVYAGELLLRTTPYKLSFWSVDHMPASEDQNAPAAIDGHIDITGIAEAVVLAGPASLTLTLEDGRRMAFQLANTGGAIVGKGWVPS
jgi:hypothetical protein